MGRRLFRLSINRKSNMRNLLACSITLLHWMVKRGVTHWYCPYLIIHTILKFNEIPVMYAALYFFAGGGDFSLLQRSFLFLTCSCWQLQARRKPWVISLYRSIIISYYPFSTFMFLAGCEIYLWYLCINHVNMRQVNQILKSLRSSFILPVQQSFEAINQQKATLIPFVSSGLDQSTYKETLSCNTYTERVSFRECRLERTGLWLPWNRAG